MMRVVAIVLFLCALFGGVASAHIGSPDVVYEGTAGPYTVLVSVQPPDVIPGVAQILVRTEQPGVSRVTVQPVLLGRDRDSAPTPDEAKPVPGDPRAFAGELWLMAFGSYGINIHVEGAAGSGATLIPVPAVATARRQMDVKMAGLLGVLGVLLVTGAVSIVGAGVQESVLSPGNSVPAANRRRGRIVMAVASVLCIAALFFGDKWWNAVDAAYRESLYKPIALETQVRADAGGSLLNVALEDPGWLNRRTDDLIPDHGKLMHLFLVREPKLDAFAHTHPVRQADGSFDMRLPALPAGTYRLYADVVHENGLAETLTGTTQLPDIAAPTAPLSDPDDSSLTNITTTGTVQTLQDGTTMRWELPDGGVKAGKLASLRFIVAAADGRPVELEPYLGMLGHAAVRRDDGSVFVHLHPSGTVSMAAQDAFAKRLAQQPAKLGTPPLEIDHAAHMRGGGDIVSFPYAFPKPGAYRLWIQVKHQGRVLTGVFDANVK